MASLYAERPPRGRVREFDSHPQVRGEARPQAAASARCYTALAQILPVNAELWQTGGLEGSWPSIKDILLVFPV